MSETDTDTDSDSVQSDNIRQGISNTYIHLYKPCHKVPFPKKTRSRMQDIKYLQKKGRKLMNKFTTMCNTNYDAKIVQELLGWMPGGRALK